MYDVMSLEFSTWPRWLRYVIDFMGTAPFVFVVAFVLGTWLLVVNAEASARRVLVKKLQVERDMVSGWCRDANPQTDALTRSPSQSPTAGENGQDMDLREVRSLSWQRAREDKLRDAGVIIIFV